MKAKTYLSAVLLVGIFACTSSHAWLRSPCNSDSATCTYRNGNKVCAFEGESYRTCRSDHKKTIDNSPSLMQKAIEEKRQKCRNAVVEARAKEGSGELSALIDTARLGSCNFIND